jgi:hypothetical protein
MSEDESHKITAQDETTDEVEGHRFRAGVEDEAGETEGDDDFEAHRKGTMNRPGRSA